MNFRRRPAGDPLECVLNDSVRLDDSTRRLLLIVRLVLWERQLKHYDVVLYPRPA